MTMHRWKWAALFLLVAVGIGGSPQTPAHADNSDSSSAQTPKDAKKQIKTAKSKLANLKKTQKVSDKEKAKREAELIKLNDELDNLKQSIAEEEGTLKGAEDVAKTERDDADQAHSALDKLKRDKASASERLAKFTKETDELKKSHDKDVADAKKQDVDLRAKSTEADRQEAAFEKEQAQVDKENQKSKKDLEKLQSQADAKSKAMQNSRDALKKAKDELSSAKDKRDRLTRQIADADGETKKLEDERRGSVNELQMVKTDNGKLEDRGHDAEEKRSATEKAQKQAASELAHYKDINKTKTAEVEKLERQVKDLEGLVEAGKEEVEKAKQEREDLIKRDTHAEISKGRLTAQVELLKHEYEQLVAENRARKAHGQGQ